MVFKPSDAQCVKLSCDWNTDISFVRVSIHSLRTRCMTLVFSCLYNLCVCFMWKWRKNYTLTVIFLEVWELNNSKVTCKCGKYLMWTGFNVKHTLKRGAHFLHRLYFPTCFRQRKLLKHCQLICVVYYISLTINGYISFLLLA